MKKKQLILIGSLLVGTLIAGVAISLSWFDTRTDLNPDEIYGSSETAYFAYGKGTATEPYGITNPRHLYNLAWLQYMGKFNKDTDGDGVINAVYFELGSDIDMSKFSGALPPIGTVENPFVGVFNGKEKTISNLTISSENSDLTKKPYVVSSSFSSPNIIGMFGVVGEIEGTSYDLKYDSSVLSIKDFQLENATIKTGNDNALIGIVAGYVNGSISDVTLVTPKMEFSKNTKNLSSYNAKFTNVSNYSVAGYCEEKYEKTITSTVTTLRNKVENPVQFTKEEAGDGQGWGGSIDMKEIYEDFRSVYNQVNDDSHAATYQKSITTVNQDGEGNSTTVSEDVVANVVLTGEDYTYTTSSSGTKFYQNEVKTNNGDTTASFCFDSQTNDSYLYREGQGRMALNGYAKRSVKDINTTITYNWSTVESMYLSYEDDSETNYLSYQNGKITNTTDVSNALGLYLDSENHLLLSISDNTNEVLYYLNDDSGSLSVSSSAKTTWYWNDECDAFLDKDLNCAILFNGSEWVCESPQVESYYIYSGSNYLTANSSYNGIISTNVSNATKWHYSNNQLYTYKGNDTTTPYYLGYSYSSSSNNSVTLGTSVTSFSSVEITNDTTGKVYSYSRSGRNSYYYYLTYNSNNNWSVGRSRTNYQIATLSFSPHYTSCGTKYNSSGNSFKYRTGYTTTLSDTVFETKNTFMPLKSQTDNLGVPDDKNTGYIVSGAQYNNGNGGDIYIEKHGYYYGPSSNGVQQLDNFDYSTKKFSSDWTYNDNGAVQITSSMGFQKYEKTKSSFESLLASNYSSDIDTVNNKGLLYGLKFIGGNVSLTSQNATATIQHAVINGNTYKNYQVPYDCVDFNLKDKGYINFYSGTFYPNNNSFFSLYKIERNTTNESSVITAIKHIKNVYSSSVKSKEFIYEYDDGTYSGTLTTDYSVKFKSEWIENPTLPQIGSGSYSTDVVKRAFYFEIPVNAGEYALGSVDGKEGCYLMYLDIGANAQVVNRTAVTELVKETRSTYKYAVGISIIKAGMTSGTEDVNSYCILIEDISSSSGSEITFDRESSEASSTAKVTYTNEATISCDYKKDSLDLTINDQTCKITPLSSVVKTTSRLTYYDYVLNDGTMQVYQLDKVEGFDGTTSSEGQYYMIDADGNKGENQDEYTVYDNDGKKIESPTDITIDASSTSLVYEFLLEDVNGDTTKYKITVEASGSISTTVDESTGFYQYVLDGYTFTVTSEEETTATVSVKKIGENTYKITINGEDMTSKTEVTITISKDSD